MPTIEALQARLRTEQVRLTVLSTPLSLVSAPILAIVAVALLWSRALTHVWLVMWWLAVFAVYAIRYALRIQFQRAPPKHPADFARLRLQVMALVFLTGATWGVVPFFPLAGDAFINTAILAFLIAGVTSSGVTTLAADRVVAIVFITPCLVPLTLLLLLDHNGIAKGLGFMVALHFMVAVLAIRQINSNLAENIGLRLASEAQQVRVAASEARLRDHDALNALIAIVQDRFIRDGDLHGVFTEALAALLKLTQSEYGFIGELLDSERKRYLKAHAIGNIAWNAETQKVYEQQLIAGIDLRGLDALIGTTLKERRAIVGNDTRKCSHDSGLPGNPVISNFLCVPIFLADDLMGLVYIANRKENYDASLVDKLAPLVKALAQFIDAKRIDQKRGTAERHVAIMHAQLSAFIEHTPAAVAMLDRDLRFLAHSERWRTDFITKEEQLLGKSLYEALPDMPTLWRESHERALQGAIEGEEADPYIRSDGAVRWFRWEARPWFEVGGAIGGIILFCEDVTDAKRAIDALHAREQLLVKLSARTRGMLFQMRFQKAENRTTLLYASEGARELYGLTMDELADDAGIIFRVCHPDDRLLLNEAIANAVREGGVLNVEHRICVPGKPMRWVQTEAAIERLADASIVWHGYIQDITERKLSEAASRELAQRHILAARAHGLGIWDCVMQTNKLTFDPRTYEIYAGTQEEYPNPWDLWKVRIHPDDKVRVVQETAELGTAARNDAELFITEFRICPPDGKVRRIRSRGVIERAADGKPIRVVGINWHMGLEAEQTTPVKPLAVMRHSGTSAAWAKNG